MIDESGNLNWRKSFSVTEEENKEKAGAWKFPDRCFKGNRIFQDLPSDLLVFFSFL